MAVMIRAAMRMIMTPISVMTYLIQVMMSSKLLRLSHTHPHSLVAVLSETEMLLKPKKPIGCVMAAQGTS